MGLRIGMIIHPPGGGDEARRRLTEVVERLRAAGHEVRPRVTFERGDGARLARAAAGARCDLILSAGGDGTLNEVVNGVATSAWQPRIGVLPVGTANDFAAGMGIPAELDRAVEIAVAGRPAAVDVARANERHFINVSTGGFGARAGESTTPDAKRRLGALAYVITGVREFVTLQPARGRFATEDELVYAGRFLLFAVGNARQTGGGSRLTPRASVSDALLDVLIVPAMPPLDFLALLPDLRAGTHVDEPGIIYRQVRGLRVHTTRDLHMNVDGEPLGGRRFEYGVTERPLSVMLP